MDFTSFSNVIDGRLCSAQTTYYGINPATEEKLYEVSSATEMDLNVAVHSARKVFPCWSQTSFEKRCDQVRNYAAAFVAQEDGFTELLMKETGKPVSPTMVG